MLFKVGDGYTLVASDGTLTPVTTTPINVTPAPASQLVVASGGEPPASVDAGQFFSMVLDAEDPWGNLATAFNGTVTASLANNETGTFDPGSILTVNAAAGVATFGKLAIDTAGTYQIESSSNGLTPVTSTSIIVLPNPTSPKLVWVDEPPASVIHGLEFGAFGVTLDLEDQYGNLETGFVGNVNLALDNNPGNATLAGVTSVPVSLGVAVFTGLSINVIDPGYTLVATGDGVTSPASTAINVIPIPPVSLEVSVPPPASVQVYQDFGLTVKVLDQAGVADPDFNGTVTINVPGAPGNLAGPLTVNAVSGIATFSDLTLASIGNYTLQVSSNGPPVLTSITAGTINVTAAAAAQLVLVTNPPSTVTAGSPFGFEVEVEDAYGNLASTYNGMNLTAALAANGGNANATLGGEVTAAVTNGIAVFNGLIEDQASTATGNYQVQVSTTGSNPLTVTTAPFSVTPALAAQLVVQAQPPSPVTAGASFSISVAVEDAYGNVETSLTTQVSIGLSSDPNNGVLDGTSSVLATNGVASFKSLSIEKAAVGYVIEATGDNLPAVTSNSITVTPAAATNLQILVAPPTSIPEGADFGMQIEAEDQFGNLATSFTGDVTIALTNPVSNSAGLSGGALTVPAVGGKASFLASYTQDSTSSIVATSPGLASITTAPITVTSPTSTGNPTPTPTGTPTPTPTPTGTPTPTPTGTPTPTPTPTGTPTPTPTGTPTPTPTSSSLVSMTGVTEVKNKKHQITEIILTFSGALNSAEASNIAEYKLVQAGAKGSFTARNAKAIKLLSAAYNSANNTVTLTPKKKFVLSKATELVVNGEPPSGLEDSSGRLIDGNDDGQAGGNAVAMLKKRGVSINAVLDSAVVDLLVEQDAFANFAKKTRKS
jgi:hypothetical protein